MDVGQPSSTPTTMLPPRRASRRRMRLAAGLVAVLAVIGGAATWVHHRFTTIFVDDARIAADMVALSSRLPGWITELDVIAGDSVANGAVLLRIDSREAELALRETEARLAGLAARRAELEARLAMVDRQTESQQAAQSARLEAARTALPAAVAERVFAEGEFQRAGQLFGTGSGTRQRHEQTRALLESATQRVLSVAAEIRNAEAQLATAGAAREELTVLRRQLDALDPQQRELAAQRDRIAMDIRDRTILMPFDGAVGRVFVDRGEYVTAGQRLMLIHDPARVRVEANVRETEIRYFHPGAPVRLRVDAYPGRNFDGVVERVGTAATSEFALLPSPNPSGNFTKITQRLPVRIALPQGTRDGLLRPGMMVEVEALARE
ncbi:HlyD family secretion protein [Roseomonas sp. HJA6]|uniref:HlyD family secretion protein n=1 Tax=Roseomonas alba TaxID=2846776 RepID=A0ABS7AC36_9PROT|nr:HlyD family secretion protein [Neoroseomonas alba]MBW6398870.1 HlyD family secretion protein [Neoroseomonas alba]